MTSSFSVKPTEVRALGAAFSDTLSKDMSDVQNYITAHATAQKGDGGIIFFPAVDALNLVRDLVNGFVGQIKTVTENLGENITAAARDYETREHQNTVQSRQITGALKKHEG